MKGREAPWLGFPRMNSAIVAYRMQMMQHNSCSARMHTISHHYAYTLFTHPNTFLGPPWNEGLQNTGKTKKI
jgi:hypothetical protein